MNLKEAIDNINQARINLNQTESVIPQYFKNELKEIKNYLKTQTPLPNYGRLLRIRSDRKNQPLAKIDYDALCSLEFRRVEYYTDTIKVVIRRKYNPGWEDYYIRLKIDKPEVFSKDYIEKKFEYERKLQIAEEHQKTINNITSEMSELEETIRKSMTRYNYLKTLLNGENKV